MWPAAPSTTMPSGTWQPVTMVLRSDPSGFIEWMRSPLISRKNSRPERTTPSAANRRALASPMPLLPLVTGAALSRSFIAISSAMWIHPDWGAQSRASVDSGRQSVGLLMRVFAVRPPERREVPTEVQFEVARNAVTGADLGAARL